MVYGANTVAGRRLLWKELRLIKSSMIVAPWLVCGDFNSELYKSERSDFFDGMPSSQGSLEFRECVKDVELTDIHSDGMFMTWSNKRSIRFLAKKN